MDKREKAKALDAKAKKKSASSASSKEEKKKDKVRENLERWRGMKAGDRCDWSVGLDGDGCRIPDLLPRS